MTLAELNSAMTTKGIRTLKVQRVRGLVRVTLVREDHTAVRAIGSDLDDAVARGLAMS